METYFGRYGEPSKYPALELNKDKGQPCTSVPNSGKGSYAYQPFGTCIPTPIVLMEIMIQP